MRAILSVAALAWALTSAAQAEVVDAQANGFEVRQAVHIAAPPDRVYAALTQIGRWWDSEHTYSRDASHLTLEAVAGGCLCEALPGGGSATHMRVVFAQPGKALRLEGALGPLQGMGDTGHLTWALTSKDGGTDLVQTYDVGGYAKGGLNALAAPVDGVLGEQAARLKRWIETGKP
jgi:uncharacterized protein YndB with AHSA1/START domain